IYFNSNRSGSMQIWRAAADGSAPEQVTADDFSNWSPHVSPDGLQVAFLSADKGLKSYPADADVKIRSMILDNKTVRIISNLMAGAGTFDGEPWSPDGRSLTYVSYQLLPH